MVLVLLYFSTRLLVFFFTSCCFVFYYFYYVHVCAMCKHVSAGTLGSCRDRVPEAEVSVGAAN